MINDSFSSGSEHYQSHPVFRWAIGKILSKSKLELWDLNSIDGLFFILFYDRIIRYIKHLDVKESRLLLPYSVAIGEIDELTDYYLEQSQFKNALLVTTSYAQGNVKNMNKSQLKKPLMYIEHKDEPNEETSDEPINME